MIDPIDAVIAETARLRDELESRREGYFRLFLMGTPMSFAIICAIAAMKTNQGVFPWPIVLILTAIVVIVGFQIINGLYRHQTKNAFLQKIAAAIGLDYQKGGVFPLRDIEHHKILPPCDISRIEDGFHGVVNGVSIAFEEVTLLDRTRHKRSDGSHEEREEIVFWGLAIKIGIGKKLDAHTVVLPRNATMTFFRTTFSAFQRVKLVSPKFETLFDVMSTDQVEARYVLDPAFMERFMEAGALLGTKWIEASFKDREIALVVQRNKPLFEIGSIFKPLTEDALQNVADELKIILRMVNALKLNPYTGLGAALPSRNDAKN